MVILLPYLLEIGKQNGRYSIGITVGQDVRLYVFAEMLLKVCNECQIIEYVMKPASFM